MFPYIELLKLYKIYRIHSLSSISRDYFRKVCDGLILRVRITSFSIIRSSVLRDILENNLNDKLNVNKSVLFFVRCKETIVQSRQQESNLAVCQNFESIERSSVCVAMKLNILFKIHPLLVYISGGFRALPGN